MAIKPKHDKLFRKALENPMVAHEFFDAHLPSSVRGVIDLNSLKMEKESFVEQNLRSSISDILFSVKCADSDGYVYLLTEHQSRSDHFMAFRLLKYITNIMDRHKALHPKAKHLPFIFPIVFYNGKQKYNAPMNLWDLFEDKHKKLAKEVWTNDYCLINVQDIPDEEFKTRAWSGIMEFFLKNIWNREILKKFDAIADI